MKRAIKFLRSSLILGLAVLLLPVLAFAQHYKQTNLVSDLASISTPNPPDPNLKNPWGLTRSPGGRSEERRVGKECRSRGSPYHFKKERSEIRCSCTMTKSDSHDVATVSCAR